MKCLEYKNADQMPILGLGTWKSAPGEVYTAVKEAVKMGYRHIDCAAIYGNEKEIGQAISELIKEGVVQREELWITSKLWNNNHGKDNVVPALKQTLSDLQLEYLDLYLIHWPVAFKKDVAGAQKAEDYLSLEEQPIADTWLGMEKAVELGLSRNIGVSNFSVKKLKALMKVATIKPEMNQVELHPYFQQNQLVDYCRKNDIHVTAYSPLGSSDRPEGLKSKDEPILLQDSRIEAIAKTKEITVAQVILAWIAQRGISVIPKSVNPARLQQNLASRDITLSEKELQEMAALNIDRRYVDGKFWEVAGGPYTAANVWDE
ncbi:aldo/keto reductase [Marinifilum caeruleilacunae]|uniref:Aldo/keto reductase n=1 Tax=Marinifilum caeruleilacunae TaxID=2499076 RepID=A0ABX1WQM0_9BACT|nr:aldo/keto reductase [Marinifilum caeruleilacunae]NOU58291.1 aldo/keto reductase [Marinifilum caeruleilacunae]